VRDRVELVAAMTHEGRWHTEPGYRAEHYRQAWHGLEQAYAAASARKQDCRQTQPQ
jgi:hypothetical protein